MYSCVGARLRLAPDGRPCRRCFGAAGRSGGWSLHLLVNAFRFPGPRLPHTEEKAALRVPTT